jgi:uncharacterized membrane protein
MAQGTLSVWKFSDPEGADTALKMVRQLARINLIHMYDAATVYWQQDEKKPRTQQLSPLTGSGALGGSFWGMLFGVVFFTPLLGAAMGATTGTSSGALTPVGIGDGFINRVRDGVTPGTSALFILSSEAVVDRIGDIFAGHEAPELISTNLRAEREATLRDIFGKD